MIERASNWLERPRRIVARLRAIEIPANLLAAAAIALTTFIWTYLKIGIVYGVSDDVTFYQIASGSYSGVPDGHLVYLQYALGWLISRMYSLDRHLDWYALTMLGLLCLSFLLILLRALQAAKGFWPKLQAIGVVLAGYVLFGMQHVAQFQFTTVAAVLAGTAIFWLFTSDSHAGHDRSADSAVFVLWMLASYAVRVNVFLLALPFGLIVFLYKNLDWPQRRISQLGLPIALLLGLGAIFIVERAAYSDAAWRSYLAFNDLDTQIYDYCKFPEYAENTALYESIGVSPESYDLLQRWNFIPSPSGNAATFQAIAAQCQAQFQAGSASGSLASGAKQAIYKLFDTVLDKQFALINAACVALLALLLARSATRFDGKVAFLGVSIVTIYFAEWFYLIVNGRYPDRVIWAMCLIELLVLAATIFMNEDRPTPATDRVNRLPVGLLVIGLMAAAGVYQFQIVKTAVDSIARENRRCQRVDEYIANHLGNFYFLSTRSFSHCTKTFTIRTDTRFSNWTGTGGWDFYSPLLLENWRAHGITDVEKAFVYQDNVLVLIRPPDKIDYFVDYFRSTGLHVVADPVDSIGTGDQSGSAVAYKLKVVPNSE